MESDWECWPPVNSRSVCGVDEVGRGPLAGPVVAAAVLWDPKRPFPPGIQDSKKLTAKMRQKLDPEIRQQAMAYSLSWVSAQDIDRLNILQASLWAMQQAIVSLGQRPDWVVIDGNRLPSGLTIPAKAIVQGDRRCRVIACASIIAKQARDAYMIEQSHLYPGYGWEKNMGYPTAQHCAALARLGVTPMHRQSYAPVALVLHKS